MNAVINRILVEMRNNRVTKKELPGDVAEMGGIRDDWVVKKRRLITRSKAYGLNLNVWERYVLMVNDQFLRQVIASTIHSSIMKLTMTILPPKILPYYRLTLI